jgi:hypothetical protein
MRTLIVTLCAIGLVVGCASSHKKPYADDPLLLYYKPTLSDSATILAERNARREPAPPPMPLDGRAKETETPSLKPQPALSVKEPTSATGSAN